MKKKYSSFIIILSTLISVITMVTYQNHISNSIQYEDELGKLEVVQHNKGCISNIAISNNNNNVKEMKKDGEATIDTKTYLEKNQVSQKKSSNVSKEAKKNIGNSNMDKGKNNSSKDIVNEIQLLKRSDSVESYYYDNKEAEQSVFKVSTGKIKDSLTTSDKIKLLYVSMKLGKEDYKKVEEYLYAQDAEDGVLKALKLLKADLSKKEYEKVRKIAERFIDMDAAERLN